MASDKPGKIHQVESMSALSMKIPRFMEKAQRQKASYMEARFGI